MNRAQKRNVLRKGLTAKELTTMTDHNIATGKEEGFKIGAAAAQSHANNVTLCALGKMSMTQEFVDNFIKYYNEISMSLENNETTILDIHESVKLQYNLEL